jgi:hypothetical protein
MQYKDDRLKMMNEVLNGMKVLKLYAWEPSMEKRICDIRVKEMALSRKSAYLTAFSTLSWTSAPFLVEQIATKHLQNYAQITYRWPLHHSPHLYYRHRIIF